MYGVIYPGRIVGLSATKFRRAIPAIHFSSIHRIDFISASELLKIGAMKDACEKFLINIKVEKPFEMF